MGAYEVICVTLDYDSPYDDCRRLDSLGFESTTGGITRKTPTEVHELAANHEDTVYVTYHGERREVRPAERDGQRYVRTTDEDTAEDPLLKQPSC